MTNSATVLGSTFTFRATICLVSGLVLLGACQRSEDPATAGFFDGAANLLDGTYEERQSTLQFEAAATESQKDSKAREAARLQDQSDLLAAEERVLRRQVAALDRDLEALRRRLETNRAEVRAGQDELAALEAELERLEAERRSADGGGGVTAEELARLRLEEEELQRAIDRLLELQTTIE